MDGSDVLQLGVYPFLEAEFLQERGVAFLQGILKGENGAAGCLDGADGVDEFRAEADGFGSSGCDSVLVHNYYIKAHSLTCKGLEIINLYPRDRYGHSWGNLWVIVQDLGVIAGLSLSLM